MSYQVHNSRRIPPRGPPRKRKERDDSSELGFRQPPPSAAPTPTPTPSWPTSTPAVSNNRLLAGYMAYNFITRGTLLGEECCPAGAAEPKRVTKPAEAEPGEGAVQDSYAGVASILKTEGAHIPGIVNPTQLARWIQM